MNKFSDSTPASLQAARTTVCARFGEPRTTCNDCFDCFDNGICAAPDEPGCPDCSAPPPT